MPAQANANVIALQLEKVRDKVPLLYERDDILLTMIQQRGDIETISSRNMRLPLQVNPGGKAGSYNADGGDLGRGSGTQYDVAQVSPIFFRFAIEITKLVEYATTGKERAIENATKREVANGMRQFRAFLDKLMQTAGNGVLGTISSVARTTFTMTVPSGAALVYPGQTIQIYDTTLTTNRNRGRRDDDGADARIRSPTQTIIVDNVPTGRQWRADVIVHDGLSGAQPVSLFGIKYHQNNATTGTWLNLNRATYPVILADAARERGQCRADAGERAPGDQQGEEGAGHQPPEQADRVHGGGTGTRLGKPGNHGEPDHQGRRQRRRERSGSAVHRAQDDERDSDQVQRERGPDARGFPGPVALGTRRAEGHRFLRGQWQHGVSDLWGERRDWRRRTSFTLIPRFRCGATRREAGRTSIRWRGRRGTEAGSEGGLGDGGGKGLEEAREFARRRFLYFLSFLCFLCFTLFRV